MSNQLDTKIEFIKGVGPQKAALLNKELHIFTFRDLLFHLPFRHEDRTTFHHIHDITSDQVYFQIKGTIMSMQVSGAGRKQRLNIAFSDGTSTVDLIWFHSVNWIKKYLKTGQEYVVFGKPTIFRGQVSFPHPEVEPYQAGVEQKGRFQPVYHTTETLKRKYLDSKAISKIMRVLLKDTLQYITENLSSEILESKALMPRKQALKNIHFPENAQTLQRALYRLKFEELFLIQIKLLQQKTTRKVSFPGFVFKDIPLVTKFYKEHLPFDLTDAQKRVIREIREDLRSAQQMNRLLQGDVGSGKTIVAFICALMAIDNQKQACIMAPTEILAEQHYRGLQEFADSIGIKTALLTGSTKKSVRKVIHEGLLSGEIHIIIGTHALLEKQVQFKKLGLCIIDEQHRFGVAQRAKLWTKNDDVRPHILVMTATPIPRTLAMTLYGDLDVSVIDELPKGRKPIQTVHRYDSGRLRVFGFVREEVKKGRQVYFVYPLIEESETLELKDLMDGYESIKRAFPECHLSIVHGKMKPADKEYEMQRFIKKETQIMVATTVIEVGVNVPNASVMVIENAERFGLAQLHQLRGRVGRGAEQSYCVLMSSVKLSKDGKKRLETMVRTNNGFEIADVDLKLRGPGDLAGTQQSGVLDLKVSDLAKDGQILSLARQTAQDLLSQDPELQHPSVYMIRNELNRMKKTLNNWSRIS